MKKYLIVSALVAVSMTAGMAQESSFKPGAGSLTLEVGFSPFNVDGDNIQLSDGQIRGIYSVTDNIGFRLGLGVGMISESNDNAMTEDDWQQITSSTSRISLSPGIIYNFGGTDRLTPYIGAELNFATMSAKMTIESKNSKSIIKNGGDMFSTIGLGVFSGFNYYFARNLYIGAEAGLAFESRSLKNMVTETTANGVTTTDEPKDSNSQTVIGMIALPTLRLGWTF
ncbi:MAG: porin family protein [Tannerellaceae bacterium]|jgi:opacity protein-like surface antigen|nr:porin family protein [Tannerellaceae bacterium]